MSYSYCIIIQYGCTSRCYESSVTNARTQPEAMNTPLALAVLCLSVHGGRTGRNPRAAARSNGGKHVKFLVPRGILLPSFEVASIPQIISQTYQRCSLADCVYITNETCCLPRITVACFAVCSCLPRSLFLLRCRSSTANQEPPRRGLLCCPSLWLPKGERRCDRVLSPRQPLEGERRGNLLGHRENKLHLVVLG